LKLTKEKLLGHQMPLQQSKPIKLRNFLSFSRFEVRYFNLKRDVLYFYKEKTSEFSQGCYRLKDLTDSGVFGEDHNIFYLVFFEEQLVLIL